MQTRVKRDVMKRVNATNNLNRISCRLFSLSLIFILSIVCSAQQNSRNNDYKPDRALKSNARVNPMSRAMELSIPIGGYQGRAGNGLPLTFNYSSKVWQIDFLSTWQTNGGDTKTDTQPRYSKTASAGWTSSLGVPRIIFPHNLYRGASFNTPLAGHPYDPGLCYPDCGTDNYSVYYIKQVEVVMPDGSTVQFRKDDTAHLWGSNNTSGTAEMTGNFLSVDGTKMRLELTENQKTLFLPDGSRYFFGADNTGNTLIDRHGNKMTYNAANKRWTETLGRVIEDPMPLHLDDLQQTQIVVGDKVASFPSKDGGTFDVTLSWRYLKDPNGGESGLTNPAQELAYTSDQGCQGNLNRWLSTAENPQPHLFKTGRVYQWDHFTRVCHPISWQGLNWTPGPKFNAKVLTKITLPNGQKYEFKYNIYGEIEKVIYPTGAYERFLYGEVPAVLPSTSGHYDQANRGVLERWVSAKGDGTDEQHWIYNGWDTTAPDGTKTQQFFVTDSPYNDQLYGFGNPYLGKSYEDRVLSSAPGNPILRRKLTDYEKTGAQTGGVSEAFRDPRPNKEISIIFEPGASYALAQLTETIYDTHADAEYFAQVNPKQIKTYHYITLDLTTAQTQTVSYIAALFSNANLATVTELDYLYDPNYKARNINGLVTETRIKDASGNVKAKSQISYDETNYLETASITNAPGWENPNTNYRGLATSTRSWSDIANNQYIETHAMYDQFGNVRKSWDGKGNYSEVQYADNYTDSVNRNSYAFATKTIASTNGNGTGTLFETTVKYDFNTGLPISTTDANGQTATVEYNDALLRPTRAIAPNGQQTITEYGAGTSAATRWIKVKTQIDEQKWKEGYIWFDGLGRTIKSQSVDSNGDVFSETEYDNMGRAKRATNPYRTGETKFWTESFYDDLGRAIKIKTPDNAEVLTSYGLATTGGQIGTVVTVTDQAGRQRRSITNALGQLKRVDEPNDSNQLGTIDSPNQATNYSYDTLNNLTTVSQGVQTRSFVYDSLSRLKQATNPESGLIQYNYDNNGNLTSKIDARNITTSYVYDNLNRVKTRSYSDTTPAVSYFYDNLTNAKGKLIKVSSSVSTTEYSSFDSFGRLLAHKQTTDGQTYNSAYTYNLSGTLIEETYPSGRVVKNTLNLDGDLSQVQSRKANDTFKNYANSFNYTAAGAVSSMRLGNGKWENTQFNSRLQPIQIGLGSSATSQNLLKLNFDYGGTDNNGNVKSQQITVPTVGANQGFTATQTYTYDSLNRLKDAKEMIGTTQTWKQTFLYDRYGNRRFDTTNSNTTTLPANCVVAVCNPTIDPATNKLIGYQFDNSGNTKVDANNQTFTYDAENKQVEVKNSSNQIVGQYFYDGDGKRIKKIVPSTGETTIFVYDASGKMVAEYSTQFATTPQVSYLTSDHLGSPRINTDANGQVIARHDYQPFGEEITRASYGADTTRQKFTSYERDIEINLYYAINRQYSCNIGRFTQSDPYNIIFEKEKGADEKEKQDIFVVYISQTQNWNRYAYATNNPLKFTDPDGRKPKVIDIFITLDGDEESAEGKAAWDKLVAEAKEKGITINIYRYNDGTATKEAFLKSISTPGRVTIFIGHSWNNDGLYFKGEKLKTPELDNKAAKASVIAVFSCGRGGLFENFYSTGETTMVYTNPGTGYLNVTADSNYPAGFTFASNIARGAEIEDARYWSDVTLKRTGRGRPQAADASIDSRVLPRQPARRRQR
jgi:RHS repeat-associated protein